MLGKINEKCFKCSEMQDYAKILKGRIKLFKKKMFRHRLLGRLEGDEPVEEPSCQICEYIKISGQK